MLQKIKENIKKVLIVFLAVLSIWLFFIAFTDIFFGDLVLKDLNIIYKDITVSFFSLLLLKNSALIFLLVFFISEYKVNQRQYLQYKFKKYVAYSLTSIEDRYKSEKMNNEISKISLEIYRDIVYSEPQWGKKDIKKEKKDT